MRSYDDIVRRVEALEGESLHCRVLGEVESYPIFNITLAREKARPTALVLAGTHGDEPAGVEAVLEMLEGVGEECLAACNFEFIPCLNPYGYVHNTRHNAQDADLNWSYDRVDIGEIGCLRGLVAGRRFAWVLDLHEDWESRGFYLYELRRNAPGIGAEIARRVAAVCPLNTSAEIEGHPAEDGLLFADIDKEALRGAGIPLNMYQDHTDHLLTCESPTGLEMGQRVAAHRVALQALIEVHLSTLT
jgi:protein MpaA